MNKQTIVQVTEKNSTNALIALVTTAFTHLCKYNITYSVTCVIRNVWGSAEWLLLLFFFSAKMGIFWNHEYVLVKAV